MSNLFAKECLSMGNLDRLIFYEQLQEIRNQSFFWNYKITEDQQRASAKEYFEVFNAISVNNLGLNYKIIY
jgi:hypothetical protein